jgi:hypothetical protein
MSKMSERHAERQIEPDPIRVPPRIFPSQTHAALYQAVMRHMNDEIIACRIADACYEVLHIHTLSKNLKDEFAMVALQSLLLRDDWKDVPCEGITKAAYIYADEMTAARQMPR